ncbi:MAG: UrcA family protein [Sandaracinobacteroides sp.]
MHRLFTGPALIACLLSTAPAVGADGGPGMALSTRGANLSDPAEFARLEHQIDLAAARVCGVGRSASTILRHQQNLCMIAASNEGRAKLRRIRENREARLAGL